jgi:hypothetical protein
MSGRRIAGLVAGLICAALGMVIAAPSAFATTAPAAASAAPTSAAPGDASSYPAQSPLLTVSAGSVNVGSSVTVTGSGFDAGESVDLSVTYAPSSHALGASGPQAQPAAFSLRHDAARVVSAVHVVASKDGRFSTQLSLSQAGNATITATGEQSHVSLTAAVTVQAPASAAAKKSTTNTAAKQSTKSTLSLPRWVLLILIVAIIALLVPAIIAVRRSRKPAPLDPFTSGIGVS